MAGFTHKALSDRALERQVQKAREVLGFGLGAMPTREQIKMQYTSMVKEHHPDGKNEREDWKHQPNLQMLREAKDFLIKHLENEDG